MAGRIDFDPVAHRYTHRDQQRPIPGVSSIINPVIGQDFSFVDPDKLAAAAALGTRVHDIIRQDILAGMMDRGGVFCDTVEELGYYEAWREFVTLSGFEPIYSEHLVYSAQYDYAGQLDLFGRLNGRLILPDIKRVNAVSRTAGVQTAGYLQALLEMYPAYAKEQIDRCVLHLRPGSKWQLVPFNAKTDFRIFLSALNIHHWKNNTL